MINYKRIFKTTKARNIVLNFLRFIPDKQMLYIQYWIKTGRKLDLLNPIRFSEKLQWYKLYYRNPLMKKCVDKFLVREYVASKGLDNILVPLVGKYNNIDEINWSKLPNQFVIKTTNGGGGLNIIICKNKDLLNINDVKNSLSSHNVKARTGGREWAYYGLEPGIVIEKLLINSENPDAGINDYKICCYNGEPKVVIVDVNRYIDHRRNFYDLEWNRLEVLSDCPSLEKEEIEKPKNFEQMLDIARTLSKDFPFVRVDLYNCDGAIFFGELTFYPWSGYVMFDPDEMDYYLGDGFDLKVF